MENLTVLIVDNSPEFRHLLKRHLRSRGNIDLVGEAEDGGQGLLLARLLRPDVVLMDVRMPRRNGLESTRELRAELPEVKVILLSLHDIEEYREEARASGAYGYILKKNLLQELIPAIRRAVKGSPFPQ